MTVIVWFRRNLRLQDNCSLLKATDGFDEVIPLFILDEKLLESDSLNSIRKNFLFESLEDLKNSFQKRDNSFLIKRGGVVEKLKEVSENFGVDKLFFNRSYTPFGRRRDERVKKELDLEINTFKDHVLFEKNEITTNTGKPYQKFSYYYKKWKKKDKNLPRFQEGFKTPNLADYSVRVPNSKDVRNNKIEFLGNRYSALKKLIEFKENISGYKEKGDFLAKNFTSKLSPYLKFGNISIREVYHFFDKNESSSLKEWKRQLCWRDFYFQALYNWPFIKDRCFKEKYRDMDWKKENSEHWKKFISAKTGFPLIDAAIKKLKKENWVNNRARMVLCVFAAKGLFIDWRDVHSFFKKYLIDADIPLMVGNIQWCYSIGPSSQPYFRSLNPIKQGKKYDANGEYIKKHLRELSDVPKDFIHWPHEMTETQQEEFGCILGEDYPHPIVDYKEATEKIKEKYKRFN